uniref:EOG090X0DP2 n=1 Tax=Daphnia pulicaria TaxID=35523 RepID=A0A4Y7MYR8_9CRUS|nr:EOG090X0DP2 [Daphnia pulicaria]
MDDIEVTSKLGQNFEFLEQSVYNTPIKKIKAKRRKLSIQFHLPSFLYCQVDIEGYRKVFEQYAVILQQKYPSLAIEGENHPPPYLNQKIASILGILKILLILVVVSGTNIFEHLGVQTPSVWEWTQQNKFYACLMTFFLCNAVEGQLISTGAFEITLNDVPLWSKMETGRVPQPPELFQMIDNHLNMASPQLSLDS